MQHVNVLTQGRLFVKGTTVICEVLFPVGLTVLTHVVYSDDILHVHLAPQYVYACMVEATMYVNMLLADKGIVVHIPPMP